EEAHDAVGRLRALGDPRLHLVEVELEPVLVVLRQQRVEIAEPLDEAAVAREAAVRRHDWIERPVLGAGKRHATCDVHSVWSFLLISLICLNSDYFFFPNPGNPPRPGRPGLPRPGSPPGAPGNFGGRPGMVGGRFGTPGAPPGIFAA